MEKTEIIQKLEEFNKFAEEMAELSFSKHIPKSGYSFRWEKGKGFTKLELKGPNDEAIKAFVNDIRKFFQKNDTLRIHKLIPIYQSNIVDKSEKNIFNNSLKELDKFNKQMTNHIINGENLTNEKILEVFLYGRFSHRSKTTKDIHDQWEKFGPMYISIKNEFICILHAYTILLNNVVYANKQVIRKLRQ